MKTKELERILSEELPSCQGEKREKALAFMKACRHGHLHKRDMGSVLRLWSMTGETKNLLTTWETTTDPAMILAVATMLLIDSYVALLKAESDDIGRILSSYSNARERMRSNDVDVPFSSKQPCGGALQRNLQKALDSGDIDAIIILVPLLVFHRDDTRKGKVLTADDYAIERLIYYYPYEYVVEEVKRTHQ